MANVYKDEVFTIFKDQFKINLFYKPSMIEDDIFYRMILDNVLDIELRVRYGNVMIITMITPITTEYIPKEYESLVECLMKQTKYTVLISRLGNISSITDACKKYNIPIIVDDRFLTIPDKLYRMFQKLYKDDQDRCGYYVLAVTDDAMTDEEPKEASAHRVVKDDGPAPKIELEKPKSVIEDTVPDIKVEPQQVKSNQLPPSEPRKNTNVDSVQDKILSVFDKRSDIIQNPNDKDLFLFSYLGIISVMMNIKSNFIDILDMVPVDKVHPPSLIYYMEVFEHLEKLLDLGFIITVKEVQQQQIVTICNARKYPRVQLQEYTRRNLGSFAIVKLK